MRKHIVSLALVLCGSSSTAADFQYGKPVDLVGRLTEGTGVDCCIDGQERTVIFPAILLDKAISVVSASATNTAESETPENGVLKLQLVLKSPDLWATYRAKKGKRVRVVCSLFQANTGHHLTPVLCEVVRISEPAIL